MRKGAKSGCDGDAKVRLSDECDGDERKGKRSGCGGGDDARKEKWSDECCVGGVEGVRRRGDWRNVGRACRSGNPHCYNHSLDLWRLHPELHQHLHHRYHFLPDAVHPSTRHG